MMSPAFVGRERELAALARALVGPPAPEPAEDATAARHRVFRALGELLGSLDVTALAIEDVHWADEATLEFLLFLASTRPSAAERGGHLPAGGRAARVAATTAVAAGRRRRRAAAQARPTGRGTAWRVVQNLPDIGNSALTGVYAASPADVWATAQLGGTRDG